MELSYYNSLLLLFVVFITCYKLFTKRFKNLPPSPPPLPLIGNLYHLKPPVFRTFYALSQKYGPIFSFRFSSQLSMVVSSTSLAEECFTKNDIVLANRFRSPKTKHLTYNNAVVITSPYGDHWRNLHRICFLEILSTQRLNSFMGIRRDETARLIWSLSQGLGEGFTRVEVRSKLMSDGKS
ncbi:isoflavone 3'-hydroxylase [Arachis hypogaea]